MRTVLSFLILCLVCRAASLEDMVDSLVTAGESEYGSIDAFSEALSKANLAKVDAGDMLAQLEAGSDRVWSPAFNVPGYTAGEKIRPTDMCPGVHVTRKEAMLLYLPSYTFKKCAKRFDILLQTDEAEGAAADADVLASDDEDEDEDEDADDDDEDDEDEDAEDEEKEELEGEATQPSILEISADDADALTASELTGEEASNIESDLFDQGEGEASNEAKQKGRRRQGDSEWSSSDMNEFLAIGKGYYRKPYVVASKGYYRGKGYGGRASGGYKVGVAGGTREACASAAKSEIRNKFPGDAKYAKCISKVNGMVFLQLDSGEEEGANAPVQLAMPAGTPDVFDPEDELFADDEDNEDDEDDKDEVEGDTLYAEMFDGESEGESDGESEGELLIQNDEEDYEPENEMEDLLLAITGGKGYYRPPAYKAPWRPHTKYNPGPAPTVFKKPPPPPKNNYEKYRLKRICKAQKKLRKHLRKQGKYDAKKLRECIREAKDRAKSGKSYKPRSRSIHVHIHGFDTNAIRGLVRDTVRSVLVDFYRSRITSSTRFLKPAPWAAKKKVGFDPYNPQSWKK